MTDSVDTLVAWLLADADGHILFTATTVQMQIDNQPVAAGQEIVLGKADLKTDYVLNHAVTPRPANTATINGMTISNVANPSTVTIGRGASTQVTDGVVDLEFTQPGTYNVVVSSWPALDAVFQVTQA